MSSIFKSIAYLFCSLLLFSCGKHRAGDIALSQTEIAPITDTISIPEKRTFPGEDTIMQFDELMVKMKVNAKSNQSSRNFNMVMRWKKGEKIWMSLNMIGIEGIRLLITPDSIKVLDRMNATYLKKPYQYIQTYAKIDIPYQELERILWGLPLTFNEGYLTENVSDTSWSWNGNYGGQFNIFAGIDKINKMLIEFKASDSINQRTLYSKYSDIRTMNASLFPFERYLIISNGAESVELNMKITDLQIQSGLNYPFEIPTKYEEIH